MWLQHHQNNQWMSWKRCTKKTPMVNQVPRYKFQSQKKKIYQLINSKYKVKVLDMIRRRRWILRKMGSWQSIWSKKHQKKTQIFHQYKSMRTKIRYLILEIWATFCPRILMMEKNCQLQLWTRLLIKKIFFKSLSLRYN